MRGGNQENVRDGALAIAGGRIAWMGPDREIPTTLDAAQVIDCEGRWITPGLIDCHTHLVYAGSRAQEFEQRLQGTTYEQIARAGGGILSTVRATRASSEDELLLQSRARFDALLADGATTVEIKSGYGLELETERKMLRVARKLAGDATVVTSFLAAHALPPEFAGRADAYIDHLVEQMLPALAGERLIDAVDGFCESFAFNRSQIERLFRAARALNLRVKLHAEQASNQEGASLVAEYRGLSADHLEWLSPAGVAAMRSAGVTAVLLPGAFYCLRETRVPPIDALRSAGVPIAIATDCNPGTSPLQSLLLAMNMACILFRLTPGESLRGVTCNAARALGLDDRGVLAVGNRADLAAWSIQQPVDLCYGMGFNAGNHPLHWRMVNGELTHVRH
jgi:imidazolonepropionase